ncbi:MAG: hypothetical protein JST54_04660 [Deltaproteobacteria bacterium]|nr:hypothetical protein [Deltaproteobacteria bacterium]
MFAALMFLVGFVEVVSVRLHRRREFDYPCADRWNNVRILVAKRDIPAGTVITRESFEPPPDWNRRCPAVPGAIP